MLLPTKLGIASGVMLSISVFFLFIGFPKFLKSQIHKASALGPGSEMRDLWADLPIPLDFRIFLFNVTNADDVAKGENPIVKEVGPYFYDEWKKKIDLVDREEDDTVEYSMKNTWIFNPAKSNGLTGDEEIVFPHLLILGIIMGTLKEKPTAMGLVGKAINSIFKKPETIFVKAKVKDLLFDGLPVDCTVTDFAGSAVCSILKEQATDLVPDGENRYLFSFFGGKNGTVVRERLRVLRGLKRSTDVGIVTEFDGKPTQSIWAGDDCNNFNGTDSTIFHAYLYENEDLVSFAPDLCRSMGISFEKKSKVAGIKTNRYTGDLGDMSTQPELKCFCETENTDSCYKKGIFDLSKCVGAPIIATLPHMYLTDEMYLKNVTGLHPNKEEHEIFVEFEPMTGTPVSARKRLQFNIFLQPVEKLKLMKNYPYALLPLIWVEEGILLEGDFLKQLKSVFTILKVVAVLKYLLLLGGLGLGGTAGFLKYKANVLTRTMSVTKVPPKSAGSTADSATEKKQWPLNVQNLQAANLPANLDA